MPDGKVEFDVELNTSKIPGDINKVKRQIAAVDGKTANITVKASVSSATADLDTVAKKVAGIDGSTPEITIKATDSASDTLDDVKKAADETDAKAPDVNVTATDSATETLEDVQTTADETGAKSPDVNVTATDGATAVLEDIQDEADATEGKDPNVNVSATDAATSTLEDVQAEADATEGKDPTITIDADTSAATSDLEALDDLIDEKSSKWNSVLQGIGQGAGQMLLGGAKSVVSSGLSAIFGGGMGFETGMAKIRTLLPEGTDTTNLGNQLLDMSTQYGIEIGDILDSAYEALSAGVEMGAGGKSLIDYMTGSIRLGMGGFTSTTSAGSAVAAIMNAYGLDKGDAAAQNRVSNVLLKTQNYGSTTVDQLAGSISQATTLGAAKNVPLEQIGAALSVITGKGTQTAEAITQTRRLIDELGASGSLAATNMEKAFKGTAWSGMNFSTAMKNGATFVDVLTLMDTYAQKNKLSLTDMFSSTEAGGAALALLSQDQGAQFLEFLGYMYDDTDAVTYAAETMMDTTSTSVNRIKASMNEFAINLFTALAPSIQKFLDVLTSDELKTALQNISDAFGDWMEKDGVTAVIDAVTNAIQTLLDLLSGKVTLGDLLWNALEGFFSKVGEFFGRMTVSLVNAIIDVINKLGFNIEHIDYDVLFPEPDPYPQAVTRDDVLERDREKEGGPVTRQDVLNAREKERINNQYYTEAEAQMREGRRPYEGYTALSSGSSGSEVTSLQKTLNDLGYTLKEDGIFGKNTEEALKAFQKESGLSQTGTVTIETVLAIQQAQQKKIDEAQQTVNRYNKEQSTPGVGPNPVTDEEYQAALKTLEEAGVTVSDSMDTMTESAILIGEGLDNTAVSIAAAGISAAQASSAGDKVKSALLALWRKLAGIKVPSNVGTGAGGSAGVKAMEYAVGLDTVPYDGYLTSLHRGEMVLNASEASAYRLTREIMALGGGGTEIDYDRLAGAMSRIGIDMDGRRVGRLVERGVSQRQYERSNARARVNG